MLKTARHPRDVASQTLCEGEERLTTLEGEVKRQKWREDVGNAAMRLVVRYQRPAIGVGVAVLVGVIALRAGRDIGRGGVFWEPRGGIFGNVGRVIQGMLWTRNNV